MKVLNYLLLVILCGVVSLAQATSLTVQQQQAKEQGKILWNQYNDKALPLLLKAAQAGDQDSQYYLAEFLSGYGGELTADYHNNAYWYAKAAKQSNIYAMYRLTNLCNAFPQIKECTPDQTYWHTQAMAALKPKIAANNPEALYQYYVFTREINYLKQSAEAGFPEAQYRYAIYLDRQRNEQSKKEAYTWYKKAADNGSILGVYITSTIFSDKKELNLAKKYLLEAVNASYIDAITDYIIALSNNETEYTYGLKKDVVKSYAFSLLLKEVNSRTVFFVEETDLTPEQLKEAKAFAEQWKKTHPPLSYYNSPVFNSSMDR